MAVHDVLVLVGERGPVALIVVPPALSAILMQCACENKREAVPDVDRVEECVYIKHKLHRQLLARTQQASESRADGCQRNAYSFTLILSVHAA